MSTMPLPTLEQLNAELKRTRKRRGGRAFLRGLLTLLLVLLLIAILGACMLLSVVRVQGSSMSPTLENGDVVLAFRWADVQKGDLIAFSFHDKPLVKRVAAQGGEEVFMDGDGTLTVNGEVITEAYVSALSLGDCDIAFPYTVPADRLFVLGDERSLSLDSRHHLIGCIAPEQVSGQVFVRIWPLDQIKLFP